MELTALAHLWVADRIENGDLAIDATVGNGHDTLFFARAVGPEGRVFGFDIQERALEAARRRIGQAELADRVTWVRGSHLEMKAALVEANERRQPKAILFNLGYLPGGDKTLTTVTEETLKALEAAIGLLAVRGILTIVAYPGHPEGQRETEAVLAWARQLGKRFDVVVSRLWNRPETAPCLVAVERNG